MEERQGLEEEEAAIRELFESAGRRPEVPAEDFAAIKAAARKEWRTLARERRPRSLRPLPLALAASLLLACGLGWWLKKEAPSSSKTVATVELVKGEVWKDGSTGRAAAGDALAAGTVLATEGTGSPALVALRLVGGESVRLDTGTRVRLVSGARLDLEAGAVYVDSGGRTAGGRGPEIRTPLGSVREIGTQFEVRLVAGSDPAVRVRVREGQVALLRRAAADVVAAGGELRLYGDGRLSWGRIALRGADWDWVVAAAPSLEIDGLTLDRYLAWVSRETGRRLRYAEPRLAPLAATIRLHGSIAGLTPDESLRVVLPGSGLGYRLESDTLLIRTGS